MIKAEPYSGSTKQKAPLVQGGWHGAAVTGGLFSCTFNLIILQNYS